jgi:hypothetical protein
MKPAVENAVYFLPWEISKRDGERHFEA